MRNITRPPITFADIDGFLQMPSREIRRRDITHLPFTDKLIERIQRLFHRSQRVEAVHMIDIDIVGLQPLQAAFDLLRQMDARRTSVVRPFTKRKGRLSRNQKTGTWQVLDCLAQNLLGKPLRVDISGIKKVDASFHTKIDETRSLRHIRRTPSAEKLITATESRRAKAKHGDLKTTSAKLSKFHSGFDERQPALVATYFLNCPSLREAIQKEKASRRPPDLASLLTLQPPLPAPDRVRRQEPPDW